MEKRYIFFYLYMSSLHQSITTRLNEICKNILVIVENSIYIADILCDILFKNITIHVIKYLLQQ